LNNDIGAGRAYLSGSNRKELADCDRQLGGVTGDCYQPISFLALRPGDGANRSLIARTNPAVLIQPLLHNCNLEAALFSLKASFVDQTFVNPAELFRRQTDTVELGPGDFLFREGDNGDKMYVLLEGELEIRLGDFVLETAEAGALVGEMALIDDSSRTANVVAKTASRLVPIDRRRFHFLVQQHPHFATHVMKTLASRLRHMNAVTCARPESLTDPKR
jgi:CRP/FNR family transcriptional regulator, cyclic AMP receptor protein